MVAAVTLHADLPIRVQLMRLVVLTVAAVAVLALMPLVAGVEMTLPHRM